MKGEPPLPLQIWVLVGFENSSARPQADASALGSGLRSSVVFLRLEKTHFAEVLPEGSTPTSAEILRLSTAGGE